LNQIPQVTQMTFVALLSYCNLAFLVA